MEATLINHFAIYTHTLQDANLEKENDNDNDADSKHVLEVSHTQYSLTPLLQALRDFPTSGG
jgi:hypothetical protein